MVTEFQITRQGGIKAYSSSLLTWIGSTSYRPLIAFLLTINVAVAQSTDPDCQCRAPGGGMRDLGAVECVNIVGTRHMVRCEMSTNTPYWKQLEGVEGCPDA